MRENNKKKKNHKQTNKNPSDKQNEVLKDTVLISTPVPGRARHVEEHQVRPLRLVHHHPVQLHRRVHAPHV